MTTNFTSVGNILDEGRELMGNCTINQGGYGLVPANYGSSTNGWHGPALKRNLDPKNTNLEEFEIVAVMEHNSTGKLGYGSNATTKPDNNAIYTCTANPSLRIRKDRTTNSAKVGSIPKGKDVVVSDISKSIYSSEEEPSAKNRLGKIEMYRFDKDDQKLFKFVLKDSEECYEYTEPEVYIGNTLVLSDKIRII